MSDEPKPASQPPSEGKEPPKRQTAAILAILLGGFGVHKFYLGNSTAGIIHIALTFCLLGTGAYIGWIEGIMYLMKKDEEWDQTYVVGKKAWF